MIAASVEASVIPCFIAQTFAGLTSTGVTSQIAPRLMMRR